MGVGSAIGWTIKDSTAGILRRERTAFSRYESVAREALRQHPVKADQSSFRIITPQRIKRVTCAIKRVDAMFTRPEIEFTAPGAQHPHAQAPMLFQIMWNPVFLLTARRENPARNRVTNDDVPITAQSDLTDRVMNRLFVVKRN